MYYCSENQMDYGPDPYGFSVERAAMQNQNFRTAVWTGRHMQMTLMCLLPGEDIGWEMHPDTDQLIRVEQGNAVAWMGECRNDRKFQKHLCMGDAVFVPAGTWHNIVNTGGCPLKLSSVYAPPNHSRGTIHRTKGDAREEESWSSH